VGSTQSVRRVDRLGPIRVCDSIELAEPSDADPVSAHLTPEGYLRVRGRVSGCGVYEYGDGDGEVWGELRTPAEVFDRAALDSWGCRPVTDDHPREWVTIDTIRDYQCGQVGTTWQRDAQDYLVGEILITDAALIDRIRAGKTELSCGYDARIVQDSGELDGRAYDYRQTAIRGNHLAVVDRARGGPECRLLLDGQAVPRSRPRLRTVTEITPGKIDNAMKNNPRKDAKLMIGEVEYDVPDEVAAYVADLVAAKDDEMANPDPPPVAADEPGTPAATTVTSGDSLTRERARIDVLEAELAKQRADESARIDARVELVATAKSKLGPSWSATGKTDTAIRREVIAELWPSLAARTKDGSDEYVRACFDAAIDQASKHVDSSRDLLEVTARSQQHVEPIGFGDAVLSHTTQIRDGVK
jgi:hypothetical protein